MEYRLLALLVQHAGEVVTRTIILTQIWGNAPETPTRTMDVHVRRLRKKLVLMPRGRMKALLLLCILALTMSAQDFHGVLIGGTTDWPTIINQSTKPLMGYVIQRVTTGYSPVIALVDLNSLAAGKLIQPGEERPLGRYNVVRVKSVTASEEKPLTLSYELKAVLFADGTFYGPEDVFQDFSEQVDTVRSLARDALYAQDKYDILSRKRLSPEDTLKAMRNRSTDSRTLDLRFAMAGMLLHIRDAKGIEEADAAIARIGALPDVRRSERRTTVMILLDPWAG